MSELGRVQHVTEQIREEVFQRMLGRAPDDRFDFAVDVLLDLGDDLTADALPAGRESQDVAAAVSGPEDAPDDLFQAMLSEIDTWLDDGVGLAYEMQPLAQHWARVAKVNEELGEAIEKLIAWTGQNPRKPQRDVAHFEMLGELADVALTAVLAIQHFTKDSPKTVGIVRNRLRSIHMRMLGERAVDNHDGALA
jgi:hypothetical protein